MGSKTGATPEQIAAAIRQRYETTSVWVSDLPWERMNPEIKKGMGEVLVRDAASWLVPPDSRIVSVADLEAAVQWIDDLTKDADMQTYGAAGTILDRIRALIGDN